MKYKNLRLVIISGLSGAGKTSALKCFEDLGFFCIDNLPPPLLPRLVELCTQSGNEINRIALGIDIRERSFLGDFEKVLKELIREGYPIEIIFLEAKDEVLVRRFSETRRPHPLAKDRPLIEGITLERGRMKWLRDQAKIIIDTSNYNIHSLKKEIEKHFMSEDREKALIINITSFGFKYGVPPDVDILFDVRFIPNPNFVPQLKHLTGIHIPVQKYIQSYPVTKKFIRRLFHFLDFLIPEYVREGKTYLNIGIGCTGGRHRSVFIAESLEQHIRGLGYKTNLRHRDMER